MAGFSEDTANVKREFEALSNSTQVFIWSLVGIGLMIGLLLGGVVAYGIAVEEVDGQDCIELDDELYCAEGADAQDAEEAEGDDA